MKNVLYYISGHGYGRAARSAHMIAELAARGIDVTIRTLAPDNLFFFNGPGCMRV